MASWPRTLLPRSVTPLVLQGALAAWSDTGKAQHRATGQLGVSWSEEIVPFQLGSADGMALLAFINNHWRNGLTCDIRHRAHLTHFGGATGTMLVKGGSQTGDSLLVDGLGGTNPVFLAGTIISIAGVSGIRILTADVSRSGGDATLPITPPIFVGASPADNAAITYSNVPIPAKIAAPPNIPAAGPDAFIAGLTIAFREAIS